MMRIEAIKKCFKILGAKSKEWLVFLANLKVFNQILIVIFIMLGFMLFLGWRGYQTIGKMQTMSQEVMTQNTNAMSYISNAKLNLEKIRNGYLMRLTGRVATAADYTGLLEEIKLNLSYLEAIKPEVVKELVVNIDKVKETLDAPVTEENYQKLVQNLANLTEPASTGGGDFTTLENLVGNHANQELGKTKEYANLSQIWTVIALLISAVIAVGIGLTIASSISGPLVSTVQATKALAVGDLTEHLKVQGCLEVKAMVKGLNQAIDGLRQLVTRINKQAETLAVASLELSEASNDTGRSATQVASAMTELAKAATEQTEQINKTVETINLLSELVKKVSTDTESIASSSEQVAQSAKVGQKVTGDIASEINEIYTSTQEVAKVIEELNKTGEEISNITSMISGIAEQTTLLALNAAIEAARAGEHGKGFSVVAKETGKLADQSKQSAQLIADLISQMKKRNSHAVEVIERSIHKVEAGRNLASEATTTFEGIFNSLQTNLDQIGAVAKSARQMAKSNEDVINAISNIAAFSEESMASTQEVSATAQEQSASVEQVTALAENLAQVGASLKEAISAFEIEKKA